jgi:predicted nucleotidyltransferase component of viral defense system
MEEQYKKQVVLLLRIIPELNKIPEFAMHGGTAINLFYHDMPRLSVDIDLTYIPFDSREKDLNNILHLLKGIADKLRKIITGIQIRSGAHIDEEMKLFCRLNDVEVKIEVNTINRGIMGATEQYPLCKTAQSYFNLFCEMNIVPKSQLFGGKIVAALDRQHPRDLFDTKKLLDNTNLTSELMNGFLFCLFSSKRPLYEVLNPNYLNQVSSLTNQFAGMTSETFTYTKYENERKRLIAEIHSKLTPQHKQAIINFAKGQPVWSADDWSRFPGVAWKLKNINKLKHNNPEKFQHQIMQLEKLLFY